MTDLKSTVNQTEISTILDSPITSLDYFAQFVYGFFSEIVVSDT